ncbi:PLP-dependent cysteine synthase family protein [Chelatococcus daeguensis]|uniref:PLP-dependent cysteine synthase family protein n=1 Tax=Chelatococcus daeguensis TaxID=444444 RepID=UPI0007AC2A38|nr:PLP-dependent cysteine synthase family protein [Chelatococcus daeguensis]KZE33387.1 cysteine synthase [Chelatococcus daeguensis]MBM3082940.1 PLP-dependent cysteine synthase family protein [Chelatococcus daeguensis]
MRTHPADELASAAAADICSRAWLNEAIARIEADFNRSADTHLVRLDLPRAPGITLYLKDESSHPTGSLKHRLARSLILYGLCNGRIGPATTLVEASSGSTAVSEAYFARLLGLRFIAVMPRSTSPEKVAAIAFHGGESHFVDDPKAVYETARRLAEETGGHYLDQFTYAERATDWRGNNNIAESIFTQMRLEPAPIPAWLVCGAGTGGTSATLGRYIRYQKHATRLCVADPEGSIFHRHYADRSLRELERCDCIIEGIGRPRAEPSFVPEVVDRMIAVPDAASIAAMQVTSELLGRRVGGSTGTNMWAVATIVSEMMTAGRRGSVVTLLCDAGERYSSTYYDPAWLVERRIDTAPWREKMLRFLDGCGLALTQPC